MNPPASSSRIGSASSRRSRKPDVDFDSIPNPNKPTRGRASSVATQGSANRKSPLIESATNGGQNGVNDDAGFDARDGGFPESMANGSMNMSFTQMDQGDIESDDHEKENHHFFSEKSTVGGAEDAEDFEEAMAAIEEWPDENEAEDQEMGPLKGSNVSSTSKSRKEKKIPHTPPPKKSTTKKMPLKPKVLRKRVHDNESDGTYSLRNLGELMKWCSSIKTKKTIQA